MHEKKKHLLYVKALDELGLHRCFSKTNMDTWTSGLAQHSSSEDPTFSFVF